MANRPTLTFRSNAVATAARQAKSVAQFTRACSSESDQVRGGSRRRPATAARNPVPSGSTGAYVTRDIRASTAKTASATTRTVTTRASVEARLATPPIGTTITTP